MTDESRDELRARLRWANFDTDVPEFITDRVFSRAWEDGHANGVREVEQIYDELSSIVYDAFQAGVECGQS